MANIVLLSLLPLAGTTLGAYLGVLKSKTQVDNQEETLVAIATGILGAICINLCVEAFAYVRDIKLLVGIMIGFAFTFLMDKITVQETIHSQLFWAMLIHNIPEGIIVGIALAGEITVPKLGIIASVSLQNVPDGLVVSMAALTKHGKFKSFLLGFLSGVVEPNCVAIIFLFFRAIKLVIGLAVLVGGCVSSILMIEWDLFKSCHKWKILVVSLAFTLFFNGILG